MKTTAPVMHSWFNILIAMCDDWQHSSHTRTQTFSLLVRSTLDMIVSTLGFVEAVI